MKRICQIFILLMTTMLSTALPVYAYDLEYGGICYNFYYGNSSELVVVDFKYCIDGMVNIPSYIDGKTVVAINFESSEWIEDNINVISIPETIREISYYSGDLWRNFRNCYAIIVDENNQRFSDVDGVLYNKEKSEIIMCPTKYNDTYIIPNTVTSIGYLAFYNCSSLTDITIPNSVTSIGEYAFYGSTLLTKITIPDSVTSIKDGTFRSCSSLMEIVIPNSVATIGGMAFYDCSSLTEITIPNSVTSIGSSAFYHCTSLSEITIPNSVTEIGNMAFSGCTSLAAINVENGNKYFQSMGGILYNADGDQMIACPSGITNVKIPETVTELGMGIFEGNTFITEIDLPSSITEIPQEAFRGCISLSKISIPNSITTIGHAAFYNCSSLSEITIPNSVTSIGSLAFYGCSSLTEFTISNSVTSIDDMAFYGCSSLTEFTIPSSVTSIGDWAFYGCSSLTEIIIPNSVTSIGGMAFYGCSSLTEFTISNSVISIGNGTFSGCSSLTEITIPNSVTSIGNSAFRNCSSLTEIILSEKLKYIEEYTFSSCDLEKVVMPASTPPIMYSTNAFNSNTYTNALLLVPTNAMERYKKNSQWNKFNNISPIDDITSISFAENEVSVEQGKQLKLSLITSPENAAGAITFASSNEDIAKVSENGYIIGMNIGQATITATYKGLSASCTVTVTAPVVVAKSIKFKSLVFKVGESVQMEPEVTPTNTTDKAVSWMSDAPSIATVDSDGTVWFNAVGEATISATCQNYTASMTFRVENIEAQDLNVFPAEAVGPIGHSFYMLALHNPENTTDKSVSWDSSKPEIAEIDSDGRIELKSEGQTVVTATSRTHTASAIVTVSGSTTKQVELNGNGVAILVGNKCVDIMNAPEMAQVIVCTIDGKVIDAMYAENSELHIKLSPGIYIVKVGSETTAKVIIR